MKMIFAAALMIGGLSSTQTAAHTAPVAPINPEVGVPVFPHDITDRPYEVIGPVKAEVRKATAFSADASREKIFRELWERGEKMGADAVINAQFGNARVTLMSWGSIKATGTAIRFKPVTIEAAPAAPVPDSDAPQAVADTPTVPS